MKSCTDLFTFSDTTHVSIKPPQPPPILLPPGEPSPLSDVLEGDADSNCSLYEATQQTLMLDTSVGSANSTDVKMASPEKSGEGGERPQGRGQGEGGEMLDVGGGEHVHRQRSVEGREKEGRARGGVGGTCP